MSKAKLVWSTQIRKVKMLKHWSKNSIRKISKESFLKLKDRIVARGFHDVIVVDTDNTILSGNQRKKALLELGVADVTVLFPSRPLTDDERDKIALESNNHDGEWDFSKLKSLDLDLLTEIGFSDRPIVVIY